MHRSISYAKTCKVACYSQCAHAANEYSPLSFALSVSHTHNLTTTQHYVWYHVSHVWLFWRNDHDIHGSFSRCFPLEIIKLLFGAQSFALLTTFSHIELTLPAHSLSTSNYVDRNQHELLNSGTVLPTWWALRKFWRRYQDILETKWRESMSLISSGRCHEPSPVSRSWSRQYH